MLAEDGSYIRTWKRLSEEGDFDIVDEETFLISSDGLVNTTAPANNTGPGEFTSQTVLGCGDYGRYVSVPHAISLAFACNLQTCVNVIHE